MQYLYDETGHRYLDLFAGIVTVSVGPLPSEVRERVTIRSARCSMRRRSICIPNFPMLAKKLASKMPHRSRRHLLHEHRQRGERSRDEMARLYTGNDDVIALRNAYHGGSPGAMGLTSHSTWKYPDGRRRTRASRHESRSVSQPVQREHPRRSRRSRAADIREIIRYSTPGKIAAFIAEPMQGVGGVTYGAPNYLKEAYAIMREFGGLCIADEVQTGFGRTGEHYWGFQNWDVIPDFVTMAKGLGNGVPIGAVTTRMEIAQVAHAAHPLQYVRRTIRSRWRRGSPCWTSSTKTGCRRTARVLGARFKSGLEKLQASHTLIGDVRGKGLDARRGARARPCDQGAGEAARRSTCSKRRASRACSSARAGSMATCCASSRRCASPRHDVDYRARGAGRRAVVGRGRGPALNEAQEHRDAIRSCNQGRQRRHPGRTRSPATSASSARRSPRSAPGSIRPGAEVIDATGHHVIPGVLDVHVHLELPFCGTVSADDYRSGTRAAARGGVTTRHRFRHSVCKRIARARPRTPG